VVSRQHCDLAAMTAPATRESGAAAIRFRSRTGGYSALLGRTASLARDARGDAMFNPLEHSDTAIFASMKNAVTGS
jgi:hypothetical protein